MKYADDPRCAACDAPFDLIRAPWICRECVNRLPRELSHALNTTRAEDSEAIRREALAICGVQAITRKSLAVPSRKLQREAPPCCRCPSRGYSFMQARIDGEQDEICDACGRLVYHPPTRLQTAP